MFTKDEILIHEYLKDLYRFIDYTHFHKTIRCPTVLDMIKNFSKSSGPKITAYFTKSQPILLHLSALNAFAQGPPHTGHYYEGRKEQRINSNGSQFYRRFVQQ